MDEKAEQKKHTINGLIFAAFIGWCFVAAADHFPGWAAIAGFVLIIAIGVKNNAP